MTEIVIADGSDGQTLTLTVKRRGNGTTAEDLTGYTGAVMAITSENLEIVYAGAISLAITDAANGVLTWTTDPATDNIPALPTGKRFIRLKGQVTLTGSGLKDRTEIIDIRVENDISIA
jgi:hypothetical protein